MMKDVIIGTLCGIAAMVVFKLMTPGVPVGPARVMSTPSEYYRPVDILDLPYLPTTQPDAARHKLSKVLGNIRVKQTPFEKVLAYLAKEADLNISVNWYALEQAGIHPSTPATVDYQNATARDVLQAAMKDVSGGNVKVSYVIIDGMVKISTEDDLSQYRVTRIYDVRDILARNPVRDPRTLITPGSTFDRTAQFGEPIDAFVMLIEETIDPTSWRDAGGTIGGIRGFDGSLVVTQTLPNHEEMMNLLQELRKK